MCGLCHDGVNVYVIIVVRKIYSHRRDNFRMELVIVGCRWRNSMGLKIVAAGAHLPTPTLAQTIEPTTAWAAVSFSFANTTFFYSGWTEARPEGKQW